MFVKEVDHFIEYWIDKHKLHKLLDMEDIETEFNNLLSQLIEDELGSDGSIPETNIENVTRLLNQMASILEYQERLYLETTNSPLEANRESEFTL